MRFDVAERPEPTHSSDRLVARLGAASILFSRRALGVGGALGAVLVALMLWSLSVGDFPLSLRQVFDAVAGVGDGSADFIVRTLRLPRIITGVCVGAAFGVAGALFQSLSRNPLGSPDIIGFDAGAALGAVVVVVIYQGSEFMVACGAAVAGLCTASVVLGLSWDGGIRAYRLILVGIGVGFSARAVNDFLLTRSDVRDVQRATIWLLGSLNGRTWGHVQIGVLALLVLVPCALWAQWRLDRLALGDETAAAIGVSVHRTKVAVAVVGVLLGSFAVAIAGPIAFVALVSAPIGRRLTRSPGAGVGAAGLVGALLVVGGDLAARRVFAPVELPVGITTALIGAPYLLWLLARRQRKGVL